MSKVSMSARFRLILLAVAASVFAFFLLAQAVASLSSGVHAFKLSKSQHTYTFLRAETPEFFYAWVGVDVVLGMLFAVGAFMAFRLLRAGESATAGKATAYLSELDRRAPSGLAPLWFGLAVAVTVGLVYVSA
jgi:hypothetical protein